MRPHSADADSDAGAAGGLCHSRILAHRNGSRHPHTGEPTARCPLRAALHLKLIDRISPCAICATTSAPSARAPLCQPAGRRGTAQWFLSRCTHTPEAAAADQRASVAASSARCARERRGRRRHRIGGAGVPCDCRCNSACTAIAHNAALHPTLPPSCQSARHKSDRIPTTHRP